MPISSSAATVEKKKAFKLQNQVKSIEQNVPHPSEKTLLKIAPALPIRDKRNLYVRSHSTLNPTSLSKLHDPSILSDPVPLCTHSDGLVHISRLQEEKEAQPDRISLDRRGLTSFPIIDGEPKLRLLSMQHNLVNSLELLSKQLFPSLVFLDIYDNQLEQMQSLDKLENLRVLLIGKNRIKKIEGLESLSKIEVLDLHGNQITQVGGLSNLTELKVLNLAGNQIRVIGAKDLLGLQSLQELNLRRNRLKKLLGFAEVPNLSKLFISNNDLQCVEDISNLAKSSSIKEISIDNNPISLGGDCVSFLVSYLPHLIKLNAMQITDQVRKAAMAWRRNKEITNAAFMELTSDVSSNCRREEVISNARTNWELIRSQTKCLTNNVKGVEKITKDLKPDSDFILTSLAKPNTKNPLRLVKSKTSLTSATKVPVLPDRKFNLVRSSSQDTENSQNTSSSNNSSNEFFKLPPILVPIICKMEQKSEEQSKDSSIPLSGSVSSIGPNVDSSVSSLASGSEADADGNSSASSSSSTSTKDSDCESEPNHEKEEQEVPMTEFLPKPAETMDIVAKNGCGTETSSILSITSNISIPSNTGSENSSNKSIKRNVRSAVHGKSVAPRCNVRAATAKTKKQSSPALSKDREQGGDYLIEICGRHLNVYGQGALRFIDKPWNISKAHDVNTVKFNYINFNSISGVLNKFKHRFPNVDNLIFKETNITCLGQLNALAEVQGLTSLYIDPGGNPICEKNWQSYAIYRLAHWGLKKLNNEEVTENDIKLANEEYKSLSDLVLWSLPDILLQPLLVRLRIDVNHGVTEQNAKKWLLAADPELRSVVSKEALQWKKGSVSQEDTTMRHKGKQHISDLLEEMANAMNKLVVLEEQWQTILHSFVQNTLLDYSQLDLYMKQKIQDMNK